MTTTPSPEALAMEIACEVVRHYGEGGDAEQGAAEVGKLWNDHPAYQAALAALKHRPEPVGAGEPVAASWPERWRTEGFNCAFTQAAKALRFLADHDLPSGGEQFPNSACCHQIADELEFSVKALATPPHLPPDEGAVEQLRGKLASAESIIRAYIKATGFDHAAACPVCNGIEGCSHTFAERFRGGRDEALVERVADDTQGDEDWRDTEIARREGLAKIYRQAQLTAEEKLCRAEASEQGWKRRAEYLEGQLKALRARAAIQAIPAPATDAGQSADDRTLSAAVDQNDAMRQELANIGNLVSELARAMKVDQANDDGSWPDLAGRVRKLADAARAARQSADSKPAMQHVAYFDEGQFHWMSGIRPRDCELYAAWPVKSPSAGEEA